jgi:RNase P subunit RPR2
MRQRVVAKSTAKKVAKSILESSVTTAFSDEETAQEQARLAMRLMLKYNVRFDWNLKRFYCHSCKKLIVPGVNCRVRLGHHSKILRITCNECGFVNRKVLSYSLHA